MEQLTATVANLGFPIVVAIYLLVRMENRMKDLENAINNLAIVINCIEKKDRKLQSYC
jgi:hypothetical protein